MWGSESRAPFILNLRDIKRWAVTSRPGRFTPKKEHRYCLVYYLNVLNGTNGLCVCDREFIVISAMRLRLQQTRTLTHMPAAFRFPKCNVWAVVKAVFNKKTTLFTNKLDLNWRNKLVKCYIWSNALYGAEPWTLRKVDQKYLESFEMWCWTRTENISWTKRRRMSYKKLKERRLTWVVTTYVGTRLKHVTEDKIEGRIEVPERRGRRRKKLHDGLKEKERILKIERGNNR